jgi:RsmE family RNA methyltransferase
MNLILLFEDDFYAGDKVRLRGRRLQHARAVLRTAAGERLKVGLLNGKLGTAEVLAVDESAIELSVCLDRSPPAAPAATVILALPRPKVLRRTVQGLAAFGIKSIVLLNSWRVDKSYWQSPLLQPEALREQLLLGLEQGRDTVLPTISLEARFKPFVEDRLPQLVAGSRGLIAQPGAASPCPATLDGALTLAIGPEGGFTSYEVDKFSGAGLNPVHLGARPLRVETAVFALLGRLLPCS